MPADSDRDLPDLPRRWRPFGTRIAGWFFGGLTVLLSAVMWFGLGELRHKVPTRDINLLLGCAAALFICLHALMRCRVDATADGLVVVNGYRTRHLPWTSIVNVSLPPGAPWAVLDMFDGTTVSLMGIQGSDGRRAQQVVQELHALIEASQPRGH